jgi:Kef-type K+ transport system membrane component KefB
MSPPPSPLSVARLLIAYVALLVGCVALFLVLRSFGETLTAPAPAEHPLAPKAAARVEVLPRVLLALVVIVLTARLVGRGFAWLGQPPVIGEVVAGILLGPSLLGWLAPDVSAYLLPAEIHGFLGVIAQIGVILYLFMVGLELDVGLLRRQGYEAAVISQAGIVAPFLLGVALALGLYPLLSTSNVSFTVFSLFLGVALAITAFPVLARILTDRGLTHTPLGNLALTCAAANDVTAWCLLALVVGVAQGNVNQALFVLGGAAIYFLTMTFLLRPLLVRWLRREEARPTPAGTPRTAAALLIGVLASAWVAEMIGIHALFGAFLLGALIPHDSRVARDMENNLHDVVTVLFLPVYFAFTGLRTHLGLMAGGEQWLLCGLIVLTATLGKFGGTLAAARSAGVAWRDSAALGVLMNTRGLMELVVLNVGLDLGVISPTLFAMMVVMAVLTTLVTAPLLRLLGVQPGAAKPEPERLSEPEA